MWPGPKNEQFPGSSDGEGIQGRGNGLEKAQRR